MSEFECRNNHLVPSGQHWCPICGEPVVRMDGMTARQLMQMERRDEEYYEEEEVDEEEELD